MGNRIRKLIVILVMVLPVVSYSGCRKQPKCGCDGDVLFSITGQTFDHSSVVYNADGTNAYFIVYSGMGAYYDTYYFCNPSEMFPTFSSISSDEQVKITGDVFWDCSYVTSASNSGSSSSYYYSYYKVYNIKVTKIESSLYGKK
jgi:hypothetical protein